MTAHTPEFLALFESNYGYSFHRHPPNYSLCCERVSGNAGTRQCGRKNGHGPHGAYCKQHDPAAVEARQEARWAKWEAETAALQAEAKAKKRLKEFQAACIQAIRDIAAGHNDPRALAQSIIDKEEPNA